MMRHLVLELGCVFVWHSVMRKHFEVAIVIYVEAQVC
jgi:hypothetical protein